MESNMNEDDAENDVEYGVERTCMQMMQMMSAYVSVDVGIYGEGRS